MVTLTFQEHQSKQPLLEELQKMSKTTTKASFTPDIVTKSTGEFNDDPESALLARAVEYADHIDQPLPLGSVWHKVNF